MRLRLGWIYWVKNHCRGYSWLFWDPVWAKIVKKATSILKSSTGTQQSRSTDFVTHTLGLTEIFLALVVITLATCLYNQCPSQVTNRVPRGGSEAVRNSLAFGVSNHCFVQFLLCRQLYLHCFPLAFAFQHTPTVLSAGTFNIAVGMVALEQSFQLCRKKTKEI